MPVRRIVANITTPVPAEANAFYGDLLGLDVAMDLGWIVTYSAGQEAAIQISFASEGGSGTPVPDLSIEVDDVDQVHARAKELGIEVTYPLTDEPWGVRRFCARDPFGKIVNILAHL